MKVAVMANFVKRGVPSNQAFLTAAGLAGKEEVDEVRLVHSDPLMMLGYSGDIEYAIDTVDGKIKVVYPSVSYEKALDVDFVILHYMPFHMKRALEKVRAKKVLVAHFNLHEYFIEGVLRDDISLVIDFANSMDMVVALSQRQTTLLSDILDVPVVTIPPMIDHRTLFNVKHNPDLEEFAVVGRLVTVKNHLLPILAAKHLPSHLGINIYGEGPLFDFYRKIIHDLKLYGKVVLKGEISHEKLIKELARSTALIHCSLTENRPVVILEANAIGLPVVEVHPFTAPKDLAEIMINVTEEYHRYKKVAEEKRIEVAEYDYHNIAPRFLELL